MLTNKSLCVVLEPSMSELWTMALNKIHPCRFSLMLFVVTFELTYTFYTLHFSSAFTSSRSGIIICTWWCYQGSMIIGKDKTQDWNMREQTFDSTNAAPLPLTLSCATSLQAAATIRLSFLDRGWTIDMFIVKSMKMNTTLSPGTSRACRMTWGYPSSFQSARSTWKNI